LREDLLLAPEPRLSDGSEKMEVRLLPMLEADPRRSVSEAKDVLRDPSEEADPRRSESEARDVRLLPQLLLEARRRSSASAPSMAWSEAEA
jgi:hypothetical protein